MQIWNWQERKRASQTHAQKRIQNHEKNSTKNYYAIKETLEISAIAKENERFKIKIQQNQK